MSMNDMDFDFGAEFAAFGDDLKGASYEGEYEMKVKKATAGKTQKGKMKIALTLVFTSGPYAAKGKEVNDNLYWSPENDTAARIFAHCAERGVPPALDTSGFLGARAGDTLLDDTSPMPDDIIAPRVLTPGGLLVLGGAPKVGKTDFSIALLVHMAAGVPFLCFTPPRPLRIFYFQTYCK